MNTPLVIWLLAGLLAAFIALVGLKRFMHRYTMTPLLHGRKPWVIFGLYGVGMVAACALGPIGLVYVASEERAMLKEWWDGEF